MPNLFGMPVPAPSEAAQARASLVTPVAVVCTGGGGDPSIGVRASSGCDDGDQHLGSVPIFLYFCSGGGTPVHLKWVDRHCILCPPWIRWL